MVIFNCRRAQARWKRKLSDLSKSRLQLPELWYYELLYLSLISRLTTTQWTAIFKWKHGRELNRWNRVDLPNIYLAGIKVHTLGSHLCRESFSWRLCHFLVQVSLNDNSSILQLKIKGPLTSLPILVLSNEGPVGLLSPVIKECITNNIFFTCTWRFCLHIPHILRILHRTN